MGVEKRERKGGGRRCGELGVAVDELRGSREVGVVAGDDGAGEDLAEIKERRGGGDKPEVGGSPVSGGVGNWAGRVAIHQRSEFGGRV